MSFNDDTLSAPSSVITAEKYHIQRIIERLEYGFVFVSLLIYADAILLLVLTGGANEGDGFDFLSVDYTPLKLCYLANQVITLGLLLWRYQKTLYVLQSNPLLLGIHLFVAISFTWSTAVVDTISASVAITGNTLFGLYLASRFSLKRQLEILGDVFLSIIVLSIVFVVALPQYGLMSGVHLGSWRGVFVHKNFAGLMMILACAVFLILFNVVKSKSRKVISLTSLFLTFFIILQTNSGSALLNGVLVIAVTVLSRIFKLTPRKLLVALVFLVAGVALIGLAYNEIISFVLVLLGKDPTFSGRTDIWHYIGEKIVERPLFGYGLSAFWNGTSYESLDVIEKVEWSVASSHQGFIDMTLEIGLIGSSLVCLMLWETLVRSTLRLWAYPSWLSSWPLVFISSVILINLSETILFIPNNIIWILTTMVSFSVSADVKYRKDIRKMKMSSQTILNH